MAAHGWRQTATSANWQVIERAWRTVVTPILISRSRRLVSGQYPISGIVHVLTADQGPEHILPEQVDQGMLRLLTRAAVALFRGRCRGQAEGLIQLPKWRQLAAAAKRGALEMEFDPPIEIQSQSFAFRLTRSRGEGHRDIYGPSH
jgi:hypothetical protein